MSEYSRIQELAEQIYAEATTLDKADRHMISDAAKLIEWVCYLAENPNNPEAMRAISALRRGLAGDQQN